MRELFLKQMAARFDSKLGGFGSAPKFPRPSELNLLFRCFHRMKGGSEAAAKNVLNMALTTLRAIALGGVNDHLGGGIARYSVDAYWHVPHFEKMLYDQAQLLVAYATGLDLASSRAAASCADFSTVQPTPSPRTLSSAAWRCPLCATCAAI
jgi:uncharacterized protein YyaL (SSP411 family)